MRQAIPTAPQEAIVPRTEPLGTARIRQAIARLETLPAFYPTVQKALRLLDDPATADTQIQQIIYGDPVLTSRVLKWANAAYFGSGSDVYTISLALTLAGREKFATLLYRFLAEELIHTVSGDRPAATKIREMSVATAAAAHSMAERLLRSDKEEILLAALLHNIGELMLVSHFRDSYETMRRVAGAIPRAEAEKVVFGAESPLVGKWLLEAWGFPPFYPAIVEHCADPWAAHFPGPPIAAIAVVHTARRLAEAWLGGMPATVVTESFSLRLLSTLEVDRDFLADLYLQLPAEIERSKGALA